MVTLTECQRKKRSSLMRSSFPFGDIVARIRGSGCGKRSQCPLQSVGSGHTPFFLAYGGTGFSFQKQDPHLRRKAYGSTQIHQGSTRLKISNVLGACMSDSKPTSRRSTAPPGGSSFGGVPQLQLQLVHGKFSLLNDAEGVILTGAKQSRYHGFPLWTPLSLRRWHGRLRVSSTGSPLNSRRISLKGGSFRNFDLVDSTRIGS